MKQNNSMTVEGTKEELEFALRHGIDITKHDIPSLLTRYEVEKICEELGLKATLEAVVSQRGEYSICDRAYYVLKFMNKNSNIGFATYFGVDLVSSASNYTVECASEQEKGGDYE